MKQQENVNLLETEIFTLTCPKQSSYSLVGNKDYTARIIADWETKFAKEGRTKNERVFYFKAPVEYQEPSLPTNTKYWNFWTNMVLEFSKVINSSVLQQLDFIKRDELIAYYEYFQTGIKDDPGYLMTGACLNEIFNLYKINNIRLVLVITDLDNVLKIYPDEKEDTMFVEWLFSISTKGANDRNLSVLLVSEKDMPEYDGYLGTTTSWMIDAYPHVQ